MVSKLVTQHSQVVTGKRRKRRLTMAAQISAIVIVPITIIGILLQVQWRDVPAANSTATPGPVNGEMTPGQDAHSADPVASQPALHYLADLIPASGGGNLEPLPRSVAGTPDYSHAIAVPCASGQVNDKFHEVTYSLRRRYIGLAAVIRPYQEPASLVDVQVQVFRDNEEVENLVLDVAETRTLQADLEGAAELRIRVTCELSSPTVILTEATITLA